MTQPQCRSSTGLETSLQGKPGPLDSGLLPGGRKQRSGGTASPLFVSLGGFVFSPASSMVFAEHLVASDVGGEAPGAQTAVYSWGSALDLLHHQLPKEEAVVS